MITINRFIAILIQCQIFFIIQDYYKLKQNDMEKALKTEKVIEAILGHLFILPAVIV